MGVRIAFDLRLCVKIHRDGKTEIIFGGGIVIDEYVSPILRQEKYKPRRKPS